MTDIVFLGPSMSLAEASGLCSATYLPPVQMGDVFRVVSAGAKRIAIIDGVFERVPAVWHKEILHALSVDVEVYGGGSMGALRAAELDGFGMVGVGRIYRMFAGGVLNDDDEVAVAHATAEGGYRALSIAMVNLREGLADAVRAGVVEAEAANALIDLSKARFYPERSWGAVFADAATMELADETVAALRTFVREAKPDLKRDDAAEVLRAFAERRVPSPRPEFVFEKTVYWETVETYCSAGTNGGEGARFERIRNHARLFEGDRERLTERSLLFFLLERDARRSGIRPLPDRECLSRFRIRRGLHSAAQLAAWMREGGVDQPQCLALARAEARLHDALRRHAASVDSQLETVLRLDDRYAAIADRVDRKWRAMARDGVMQVSEQDVGDFASVMAWYEARFGSVAGDASEHAADLGIGSVHQWREEVFAEYIDHQKYVGAPA